MFDKIRKDVYNILCRYIGGGYVSNSIYKFGVNVREFNEQHWEFVRNLTREEYEERGLSCKNTRGWYRCRHCEEVGNRVKSSFTKHLIICPNDCNGVKHGSSGSITLKGINDVATTHPHLTKYFVNEEDTYRYSASGCQKVKLKCPDCETIEEKFLHNLTRRGFSCSVCSDGISFPEKFVGNLLKQLKVDFKPQYSIDGRTRYDFYLPEYNCIMEVHGEQHYDSQRHHKWKSYEKEQENDRYKHKLAIKRGVGCYIVIDARESTMGWMRSSVLNSGLPILLGFGEEDIDWNAIAINCEKSLVKEVCDYFSTNGGNTYAIAEVFNISSTTVGKYLKRGTELGWCEYTDEVKIQNKRASSRQVGLASGKRVQGTHVRTNKVVSFKSATEAGRWLFDEGLTYSKGANAKISECCSGRKKSAYGYKWSYVN